jgi:nonsense-mediated mRNA decay protein 3
MTSRQLMTFVVLSVEPVLVESRPTARKRGVDRKMRMAEIVVAREKDFGVNDLQYTVLSHLGHLLREGDLVQGYDMTAATWTGEELDRYKDSRKGDLPDVILVRKVRYLLLPPPPDLLISSFLSLAVLHSQERSSL